MRGLDPALSRATRLSDRLLFLTGKLAYASLVRVLESMQPTDFGYEVRNLGVNVAALMTADMVRRRLVDLRGASQVVVPGRCRGDFDALSRDFGVPFVRGPEELKDLPEFFGGKAQRPVLDRYDCEIFAEIVDAPRLTVEAILARAERYRRDGADVIDLGFLPATPFAHAAEAVHALKASGFRVSVDSLEIDDLSVGASAGADYVLSLTEATAASCDGIAAVPVLIPTPPDDLDSLDRAIETLARRNRRFYVDPILEPIHHGFTASLARYREVRRRYPEVPILMGIGNLTELTDADTTGINTVLFGVVSELGIQAVLTTEVSPHARRAVREADWARRMMFAARAMAAIPKGFSDELLTVHDKKPFPDSAEEVARLAQTIRDPNFRIQVSGAGIHVYNRDGLRTATDAFELFPTLGVEQDGAHAFYLGIELARAEIAWALGKRYTQDEPLDWGCAVERAPVDLTRQTEEGTTLAARRHRHRKADNDS